jgi:hypothetical protein
MNTIVPEIVHHSEVNTVNTAVPETGDTSAIVAMDTMVPERRKIVSLTDFVNEPAQDESRSALTVLSLRRKETNYVRLFTDQCADVAVHYLKETDTWAGGYVHCLGQNCPACAARFNPIRQLLLPVADLEDGRVKVLRMPAEKGPGKLVTEIAKVLNLPNRADFVVRITLTADRIYVVEVVREEPLDPDIRAAIKQFDQQAKAGVVDIASVVTRIPASEMREHEGIAKRLELEGHRPSAAS